MKQVEDLYKAKLRAKDAQLMSMEERFKDRQAIDSEKMASVRSRVANAEKDAQKKIEYEYSNILEQKSGQIKAQTDELREF